MSIRPTTLLGHPALHAENKTVIDFKNPKIKQVINDLCDSMRDKQLIGMAAPQIAENYRIFVTEPRETEFRPKDQSDQFRVYINPVIIDFSVQKNLIFEGCGSVLDGAILGPVQRSAQITIEAFDQERRKFRLTCDGILARVIQHEMDHLQGVEFLEVVSDYKQLVVQEYYIERIKNSAEQLAASRISVVKCEYL